MEKPGTINVVGEDKALEISRAIIRTHEYVIQNVAVLNDRERGYMFNEYFPAVKDYLIFEPNVLVPMAPEDPPNESRERKPLMDRFQFSRDDGQPDTVKLSALPGDILSVRVSRNKDTDKEGYTYMLEPVKHWTVNKLTGVIDFMADINTEEIMDYLGVKISYYIYVEYTAINPAYEVGTDGEN